MAAGDTITIGRDTRERMLWAEDCPALAEVGILALGLSDAADGFSIERSDPRKGVLIASLAGRGWARIDGVRRGLEPGTVFVAPPRVPHLYLADRAGWRICWVHWRDDSSAAFAGATAPALAPGDGRDLAAAIGGLIDERSGAGDAAIVRRWCELVHALALRLARRWRTPARLGGLWRAVEGDLGRRWTLRALGRLAGLGDEALRVACRRETGRSPLRQVAWLRMRRASGLLLDGLPVHEVAAHLGYDDPFAFSAAFKRATGRSPSAHRRRPGRDRPAPAAPATRPG